MKVSVITVSFNSARTIEETIKSVISQKEVEIEYIVIDGDSTDATHSILSRYESSFSQLIIEKDDGIYDAMNKGIRLSSGDIICLLNSDDIFSASDVLSKVRDNFLSYPELSAVLSDVGHCKNKSDLVRADRLVSAKYFSPWKMRFGFNPPHPGIFLRSSVYEKYGLFRQDFKTGADLEFMVRLFCKKRISYLKVDLCSVIMRDGGVSTRGWRSFHQNTKEMSRACKVNDIKTNYAVLLMRLPIKWFFQRIIFKIKRLNQVDF